MVQEKGVKTAKAEQSCGCIKNGRILLANPPKARINALGRLKIVLSWPVLQPILSSPTVSGRYWDSPEGKRLDRVDWSNHPSRPRRLTNRTRPEMEDLVIQTRHELRQERFQMHSFQFSRNPPYLSSGRFFLNQCPPQLSTVRRLS